MMMMMMMLTLTCKIDVHCLKMFDVFVYCQLMPRPPRQWEVQSIDSCEWLEGSDPNGEPDTVRVKWKGWPELTWEPRASLSHLDVYKTFLLSGDCRMKRQLAMIAIGKRPRLEHHGASDASSDSDEDSRPLSLFLLHKVRQPAAAAASAAPDPVVAAAAAAGATAAAGAAAAPIDAAGVAHATRIKQAAVHRAIIHAELDRVMNLLNVIRDKDETIRELQLKLQLAQRCARCTASSSEINSGSVSQQPHEVAADSARPATASQSAHSRT